MDGSRNARLVRRRMGRDDGGDDVSVRGADGRALLAHDKEPLASRTASFHVRLSRRVDERRSACLRARDHRRTHLGRRARMGSRRSLGRRGDPDRCRCLRVDAAQRRLPRQMPQSARLLARLLAQRTLGCAPDGCKARGLVYWLLLGSDGIALRAWGNERRLDGSRRRAHRIRKVDPVPSYCDLRDGGHPARARRALDRRSRHHPCAYRPRERLHVSRWTR